MCLAADVPLIESGTAGFVGQVTVIAKVRFVLNSRHSNASVTGQDRVL